MENNSLNGTTVTDSCVSKWVRDVPLSVLSSHNNKSGMSKELQDVYKNIRELLPKQLKLFQAFLSSLHTTPTMVIYDYDQVDEDALLSSKTSTLSPSITPRKVALAGMQSHLEKLGFSLSTEIGRIRYSEFFKPLPLSYEICYVRHGRTEGNTEPRVFQGQVDYLSNFLNSIGQEQAVEAAARVKSIGTGEGWVPDVVLVSPLTRAKQTALPYLMQRCTESVLSVVDDGLKEMAFGCWDNKHLGDLPADSIAHLFYLQQNALVKSSDPHKVDVQLLPPCDCYHRKKRERERGRQEEETEEEMKEIDSENFVEVLSRSRAALLELNKHPLVERAAKRMEALSKNGGGDNMNTASEKVKVLMFGHSMSGAAISMLMGHGKCDDAGYLGFDGSYIMPNAMPTFLPARYPTKE
eukprot:GHVS01029820.1.p1 GENE.GHVS01029820.1~~GHVS01029820.1.p1  ORF type:complete len:409 (+),score=68.84 GHVS01029820.1:378-1604(+)